MCVSFGNFHSKHTHSGEAAVAAAGSAVRARFVAGNGAAADVGTRLMARWWGDVANLTLHFSHFISYESE